jgi:hypothetical protein
MGIAEFLEEARLEGSQISLEAFVNSWSKFREFIVLDPR